MKNWKTTVGGIISALGAFLIGQNNPVIHLTGQILAPVGLFLMGAAATDSTTPSA